MMNLSWHCKHLSELTLTQLYNILQLRSEIFVVEQKCIFQDMDGLDQESHHFMAWNNEQLVAYTRAFTTRPVIQRTIYWQDSGGAKSA